MTCPFLLRVPPMASTCLWQTAWKSSTLLGHHLTFNNHVLAMASSCSYHAWAYRAICHIRHLLTEDVAQTFACSLILSGIDYCNAVLNSAPSGIIQKLQRVQNNLARIINQTPQRSRAKSMLHRLPVEQHIMYKLAILTYKTWQTSLPEYLSQYMQQHAVTAIIVSSTTATVSYTHLTLPTNREV